MKDKNGKIVWNLGLKKTHRNNKLELVMPDELGQLPETNNLDQMVSWPLNPHFTGRTTIIEMLNTNYAHGFLKATII